MIGNISTPGGIRPVRFGAGIGAIGGDTYRQAVIDTNPVGYWRLGERSGTVARDEMGANNGTYFGNPTLGVPGLLAGDPDGAASFAGSTQVMQAAVSLTAPYTLAYWAVGAAASSPDRSVRLGAGFPAFPAFYAGGPLMFLSSTNYRYAVGTFFDGLPHMFVFVVVGSANGDVLNSLIYVDGVARAIGGYSTAGAPTAPTGLYTGGPVAGVAPIDEPAIWNRALTPAEVAMLNAIGRGTW